MKKPTLTLRGPARAYIEDLGLVFGTPSAALAALIESSEEYASWRAQTAMCPRCKAYVMVSKKYKNTFARHHVRNPDGPKPYWLVCENTGHRIPPGSHQVDHPEARVVVRELIKHHLRNMYPEE